MQLTLGPIQYYWPRNDVYHFYEELLQSPLDVIYLGEVVCGKRHQLKTSDWIELAQQISENSDKQLVLSTLTLLESSADLTAVKKICDNSFTLVEANDFSAIQLLSEAGLPFVCGPAINVYNHHSLQHLMDLGLRRWVVPVEISRHQLQAVVAGLHHLPEVEVLAWGHMPLAYSARCFTARHLGLAKDQCDYRCIDYPAGLELKTQEDQSLFTVNGIATLSGQPVNLLHCFSDFEELGVSHLRLSPEWQQTQDVVSAFDDVRQRQPAKLSGGVDGYWRGHAGLELIARA